MVEKDYRIFMARDLVRFRKDVTLQMLYQVIPRKVIAENLGLNINSFINFRSKDPENFKLKELIKFAEVFELELEEVVGLFERSIIDKNTD